MRPLVSIIIPTYNNAEVIVDAIDSALAQSYEPKEVIVVDDGSTDDTLLVIQGYSDKARIIRQENAGPGAARNHGVKMASGELVAFLDADDLWLPGKLVAQVDLIAQNPNIGLAYHDWHVVQFGSGESKNFAATSRIRETWAPLPARRIEIRWLYNELLLESALCTDTVMIRRDLFEALGGFDEELPQGQDYDLWLRASRKTEIAKLGEKLAVVRIRPSSITTTPRRTNFRAIILQRALDNWGTTGPDGRVTEDHVIRATLGRIWFGFGYQHLLGGDAALARDAFIRSIRLNPFSTKAWVNLVRSWFKVSR